MKRLLFYRQLYTSPAIRYPAAVKWHLNHDADDPALYIITLCDEALCQEGSSHSVSHSAESSGEDQTISSLDGVLRPYGQIEFFHCGFLRQRRIREHCPMIIGVAEGRWEAVELVRRIVEDTLRETGALDIVAYLASVDSRIHYAPAPERVSAPLETGGAPSDPGTDRGGTKEEIHVFERCVAPSDPGPDRSDTNPEVGTGRTAEGGGI